MASLVMRALRPRPPQGVRHHVLHEVREFQDIVGKPVLAVAQESPEPPPSCCQSMACMRRCCRTSWLLQGRRAPKTRRPPYWSRSRRGLLRVVASNHGRAVLASEP